jgi:VWFA-related protein
MRLRISAVLALLPLAVAPGRPDQPSIVSTVRIDAVVANPQGVPIQNCRLSDFELLEDGVPKPIASAELRTLPGFSPADTSPIESAADEERAAREPGTRTFVFFMDELHVPAGASAERARQELAVFVDSKIHARDIAVVLKPRDPVQSIRFTRDRALLHGAIAGFSGLKGKADAAESRRLVTTSLNDVAARLDRLKADRPIVVIIGEGFASGEGDLEIFARASSELHFAIYTINPTRPQEDAGDAGERQRARITRQWLAARGGGLAVEADEMIMGFARVGHDSESYWMLTYRPERADGRFHSLEARTKVRDAWIRTRTGYWASPAGTWSIPAPSIPLRDTSPPRLLRRTSFVDAWVGVLPDATGGARMVMTWEARPSRDRVPRSVAVKARAADGAMLFDGIVAAVGNVLGTGADSARFAVPPGRVELDMVVLGASGDVLDTDARNVDVPNLRSTDEAHPLLLEPQVIRLRTARDLERSRANPDATPSAARTFTRQELLLIRVAAVDASGTDVRVTATLLNQTGLPVRTVNPIDDTAWPGVTQFTLPLASLAAGEYLIELAGTNVNGRVTTRVAIRVTG